MVIISGRKRRSGGEQGALRSIYSMLMSLSSLVFGEVSEERYCVSKTTKYTLLIFLFAFFSTYFVAYWRVSGRVGVRKRGGEMAES